MKKHLLTLTLLITLAACDKAPINGALDGFWKLTTIELATGQSLTPNRIFYSIYRHSIQLSDKSTNHYGTYNGHFANEDHYILIDRFAGITPDAILAGQLLPFGINAPATRFTPIKISSRTLILQSDYATLHFQKF